MKHALNLLATALLAAGLAACDTIGDGNTIEKLQILPARHATQITRYEAGADYRLFQCLRDELIAVATFGDGTEVNFSQRTTWSSSDPAVVEVSNGDIPVVLLAGNPARDGTFYEHETIKYARGTVIPKGTPGQRATITARFSTMSAAMEVVIRKPTLRIAAVPERSGTIGPPPFYLAQDSSQRLGVLVDADGRPVWPDLRDGIHNPVNINPFRWMFDAGTFVPEDEAVAGDVDQWVIDTGMGRIAELSVVLADGIVDGVKADYLPHKVIAESSLCPASVNDTTLRPEADVQVATLYDDPATTVDDRLVLTAETGFTPSGAPAFAAGDQVAGTNQQLQLRALLDVEGDGSTLVEHYFNGNATYTVQPLNASCESGDDLLGCGANKTFSVSGGLAAAVQSAEEGAPGRIQACFPVCLPTRATLTASAASVTTADPVTFTAAAFDVPADVNDPATPLAVRYVFDFGDGTAEVTQSSPSVDHTYGTAGTYTATVRILEPSPNDDFLSQNAGAVRILVDAAPPAGNTAPTAKLTATVAEGDAPLVTTLDGRGSTDADSGDAVTVYEFDPGDGSPVIRQTSGLLRHVYADGTAGPFTPTLRVYDESGVASAVADGPEITVDGVSTAFVRSNVVSLQARKARLCSVTLQPVPGANATEAAFTFPGLQFDALGSFVADTDTDACTDPVIGRQLITRFMSWLVRPAGVDDELSLVTQMQRLTSDDFLVPGQMVYSEDVPAPTTVDITATPVSPFSSDIEPTPTTLTVTPCTTCTP